MKRDPNEAAGGNIGNGIAISTNDEIGTRTNFETNFETEPADGELIANAPTLASRQRRQEQPPQQGVTQPEPVSRLQVAHTIGIFKHGGETETFEELPPYYPS